MKKIINIILLLILIMPISVKADMGAPDIMGYYVTPRSVDGAPYYDGSLSDENIAGTILYGEKVQVIFESSDSDELIGTIEIGNDNYDIYLEDFITVSDEYKPSIKDEYTEKVNYTGKILATSGLKMYKGPSKAYESYEFIIPYGTEIKVEYENASIWVYGEYNGTKGWIMSYNGTFGKYNSDTKKPLTIAASVEIKESLAMDAKTLATIPALETFDEYYSLDAWAWAYYVTYNGVTGYIDSEIVLRHSLEEYANEKNIVGVDLAVYETAEENSKKVGTIKALEVFYVKGYVGNHSDYYYVECDDLKGYISSYNDDLYFITESDEYYDDLISGKITYKEYLEIEEDTYDDYEDEEIDDDNDEDKVDDKEKDDKYSSKEEADIGPKEIVILCVGSAVIIALTATVVIILMNKKSKKNKEQVNVSILEQTDNKYQELEKNNIESIQSPEENNEKEKDSQ